MTNPAGSATGSDRVIRGSDFSRHAWFSRSANRALIGPSDAGEAPGFRVVLAVDQSLFPDLTITQQPMDR